MRVLFAGTPDSAVPVLKYLLESEHQVVGVLTRPPARSGRGRRLCPSPVAQVAEQAGLQVFTPSSLKDTQRRPDFAALHADLAVVVAYGLLIPKDLLNVFPHGWINLHYSLLPKWRGASPVQHSRIAGEEITGVSIFRIDEGMDTGPIYAVDPIRVAPQTTADLLLKRLTDAGIGLLPHVLGALEAGQVKAHTQANEGASYAPLLTKADAQIPWEKSAEEVANLICAFTSQPGAWTLLPDGKRLGIYPVIEMHDHDTLQPGQVVVTKHEVTVGTGSNDVKLTFVTPAGKREMAADAWGRGQRYGAEFFFGLPRQKEENQCE
ncbi:methionyl-tRNA formyltransferase [Varibaculum vaginae]|uniref:methionyl-tRNA formyltransferase n=1 Tax=Varibaculum vaginae TaxID=2364797 RepID=UPI000F081117|nr:methionyl-tRNA formyltransferase [Varibaculum vaginae]